jgi:hypothetical protein
LEVTVEVTLVGEAGRGGSRGDRLPALEQAAGNANTVGEVKGMGWEARLVAEHANEPELADAGGGSELVEADVSLGPGGEVVAGRPERPVVTGAESRLPRGAAEKCSITAWSQVASRSSRSSRVAVVSNATCSWKNARASCGSLMTGSGNAISGQDSDSGSHARLARSAWSMTMRRAVHGRAPTALPAWGLEGSQATSCPGSTRRRSRPRRERIGCRATIPNTYSPLGSTA